MAERCFFVFFKWMEKRYTEIHQKTDRKRMEEDIMAKQHAPFRYDYVGSFLRPEKLKEARKALEEGKITAEELKAVEDEAIRDLVKKQKEAGYHVITD